MRKTYCLCVEKQVAEVDAYKKDGYAPLHVTKLEMQTHDGSKFGNKQTADVQNTVQRNCQIRFTSLTFT